MQRQKRTKAKRHFKGALALILESHLSNRLLKDKLAIREGAVRTHTWSGMKGLLLQQSCLIPVPLSMWSFMNPVVVFLFSLYFVFIWRTNCLLSCFCVSCMGLGNGCIRIMVIVRGVICRFAAFPCVLSSLWLLPSPSLSIQVHVSVSRVLCLCCLTMVHLTDRITTMLTQHGVINQCSCIQWR